MDSLGQIFDGVADFSDGPKPCEITGSGTISLKSYQGKYLSAVGNGGLEWNRDWEREWEQFRVEHHGEDKIALKSYHGMYLSVKDGGETVRCDEREALKSAIWRVEAAGAGIALKSCFGKYLRPNKDGSVAAIRGEVTKEETFTVNWINKEKK
jgi:hypothetical protein